MTLSRDEQDAKDEMDYREEVQREIDDEADAKRAASGFSPEQLKILDAANDGRKAGLWGYGASLNPHQPGTPEHEAWDKARMQTLSRRLNGPALRRLP